MSAIIKQLASEFPSAGFEFDGEYILSLEFADDLIIFSSDPATLVAIVNRLEEIAKSFGLAVNASRTKTMGLAGTGFEVFIEGQPVADVQQYLRTVIDLKGDASCAVVHKISKARTRFEMLFKPIFSRSTLSIVLKSRLFDALVRSVLLYGLKTTALTADLHNIQVFDKSCQRRLVRGWQQRLINGRLVWVSINDTELHQRTKLREIDEQIELSRLRFGGHCMRRPHLFPAKSLAMQNYGWRRPPGRPRKSIRHVLQIDIQKRDRRVNGWFTAFRVLQRATDKDFWRKFMRASDHPTDSKQHGPSFHCLFLAKLIFTIRIDPRDFLYFTFQ
jgi:hypothetical protein